MFRRLAVALAAVLLLGGCVLHTPKPLFADRDARLALGQVGGTTETSSLRDGQWVIDKQRAVIAVEGNHYVVRGKTNVALHFTGLRDDWFVMQVQEEQGPAGYMLAKVKDRVATVHPLLCKDLAKDHAASHSITFVGDNCAINRDASAKKLFTALLKKTDKPSFRLQIIH